MGSISDIGIMCLILFPPIGVICLVIGIRMMRGKSLQYIAGNTNNVYDGADEGEQKAFGVAIGAVLVGVGVLMFASALLGALFG